MPNQFKPHRMKDFYYGQGHLYSITICSDSKKPVFRNPDYCKAIQESLLYYNNQGIINLICFCIMPDHVYILLKIVKNRLSLSAWVSNFKRYTSNSVGISLWQRNYYDHIVRREEDAEQALMYIMNNPVRKELVENWRDYPYSWMKFDENEL